MKAGERRRVAARKEVLDAIAAATHRDARMDAGGLMFFLSGWLGIEAELTAALATQTNTEAQP